MEATEEIINMAKENNVTVTTAMVVAAGFSRGNIKYLVDRGMIEQSARGVYILPEVLDDEIFNLQNRFRRGIYSRETALFLWDLTDRTPSRYCMTFPMNYNLTRPKEESVDYYLNKTLADLALAFAHVSTYGICFYIFHQPEVPKELLDSREE